MNDRNFRGCGGMGAWILVIMFCASLAWGNMWTRLGAIVVWLMIAGVVAWFAYQDKHKNGR